MYRYPDPLAVICSLGFVIANIFALAVWSYGLRKTGLGFCYVMILVAGVGIILSLVQTLIYYNPTFVLLRLGLPGYRVLFYTCIYSALLTLILSVVASAMIVRWVCKSHQRRNEPQSV
jgi:hypothetical protein